MSEESLPRPSRPSIPPAAPTAAPWRLNLVLFLATVASVMLTAVLSDPAPLGSATAWVHGAQFTFALLGILGAHELGHYFAARCHEVDASLPYFIPMPLLSPFGTMGAVIRMRGVIPTREALLDIGASGPLAGMAVAIPLYLWGSAHSKVIEVGSIDGVELGESILVKLLDRVAHPVGPGQTLELSPVAFAAWGGMFVTMINLLPVGQLDGGHVAYALFGERQNRIAPWVHRSMLAFFGVSLASYLARDLTHGLGFARLGQHVGNSIFWLVWFEVVAILGTLSARGARRGPAQVEEPRLSVGTRVLTTGGLVFLASAGREKGGALVWLAFFAGLALLVAMELRDGALRESPLLDHPPTAPNGLGAGRTVVAAVTLALFALLFMPTPITM
jgi:membrane-associated protease RseP (regulator of RpoE activity)